MPRRMLSRPRLEAMSTPSLPATPPAEALTLHRSPKLPSPPDPVPPWPQPPLEIDPFSDAEAWVVPPWPRDPTFGGSYIEGPVVPSFFEGSRPLPHYPRATLELVGALGIGTAWYWSNTDLNSLDWDYTWRWNSQRHRHTNLAGWRFDDNTLHLNSPGHPLAGGAYYALARANDLSIPASVLASFLTGLAWEIFVEYKEVVSINDLVLTGIAGVPLGEAFHQLGEFFRRSHPTASNRVFSWIFGLPVRFHHWLDGTVQPRAASVDDRGWPTDLWRRFELTIGASAVPIGVPEDRSGLEAGIRGELIELKDYSRPGKDITWAQGALMTGMGLGTTLTPSGVEDFLLDAKLTFAGIHARRLEKNSDSGALEGFNLFFGSTIAFLHDEYAYPGFRDRVGAVHLPGASMHLRVLGETVELRYSIDFHPDFGAVQSAALSDYAMVGNLDGTKSVLANQGYYYAIGFTRNYRLELAYKGLVLRSNLSRQNYRSIDGYDRFQFEMTDDFSVADARTTRETSLEVAIPRSPAFFGVSSQRRVRSGTIRTTETELEERRLVARLRLGF